MYSREETQRLKRDFWIAFAEKYPRKWVLYDTKIKDLVFEKKFVLENGKTISRIWVEKLGVSVSNKQYWDEIFDFLNEKMHALEMFFLEYDEFIKAI